MCSGFVLETALEILVGQNPVLKALVAQNPFLQAFVAQNPLPKALVAQNPLVAVIFYALKRPATPLQNGQPGRP